MAGDHLAKVKSLHVPPSFGNLPSYWSWLRLDDACEGIFDCPHSTPKLTDVGPLVVRTQDIITGVFRTEQAAHVSEETYIERTSRVAPSRGDLLYSREGTYFGIAAEVPERTRVCLGQRMVLIRPRKDVLDFRFLRHWLNSPIMASHIHGYRDGSVAERLNLPTIRALPIVIPPLEEQRAIAHILGTLDDKIELNRRVNETLEAMAQALFKSWFVDFDPVRAKAERRDPCLPKPIADLFPDTFEDSELGEIPKGWVVKNLGELFTLEKGLSYKGQYLTDGGVPMVNLGCFLGRGRFNLAALKGYSGDFQSRHTVKEGDLVLANTDITQKREVIGSPGIVPPMQNTDAVIFTHHVFAARFNKGHESWKEFAFYALLREEYRERATGFATGTTVLALPRDAVLDFQFAAPPPSVLDAFTEIARQHRSRQWSAEEESRTLRTLRDTLLPKLISGELRASPSARVA